MSGESALKRLVICTVSGSSDASCEASLSLLSIFTFVDSPTVMGTSTRGKTFARFSSLRSRARGESALKRLVKCADSDIYYKLEYLLALLVVLTPSERSEVSRGYITPQAIIFFLLNLLVFI